MKQTILATIILLLTIYFIYPTSDTQRSNSIVNQSRSVYVKDNTFLPYYSNIKDKKYKVIYPERISVPDNYHYYNSISILPIKENNSPYYNIKSEKFQHINTQKIFAENVILNYKCEIKPFQKENLKEEGIVKTGKMQCVDFGNNDDLPNNPSKAPLNDDIIPLLLCALFETAHISSSMHKKI